MPQPRVSPGRWTFSPDPCVEERVARIFRERPQAPSGGGERMRALLRALGDPHLRLPPVFHVAGTNGKGSVLAFLQSVFEAGGLSAHKYTSPHLVRFEERMVLNGAPIAPDVLMDLMDEGAAALERTGATFFEFFPALMFLAASRVPADVLLLETGVGGLRDSTNVVPETVAVLTRISFDHTHILGDTLPLIAAEKAGIMRRGRPAVAAPQKDAAVMKVFEEEAAKAGARLFRAGHEWRVRAEGAGFVFEGEKVSARLPAPGLLGAHQVENAGAAIAALSLGGFPALLKEDVLARGIAGARWPARMQRLVSGPAVRALPPGWELWLDGAHNDSGAEALAAQLKAWGGPVHFVTALKKDKAAEAFFGPLRPCIATVHVLSEDVGAPMQEAGALLHALSALGLPEPQVAGDLESAVRAIASQSPAPARIMVAGSLYLAGQILRNHG